MKNMNKVDLTKLKSKVKERPIYYCKCGLSKRYSYCDGRHGCDEQASVNTESNDGQTENSDNK